MYESLLPERAQPEYRLSRWKKDLDVRASKLLARGCSPVTVGLHLCEWVDFVRGYEHDGVELPTHIRCPEVVVYLDRRCAQHQHGQRHVRARLRLLLQHDEDQIRRLAPERRPTTALYEKHVPAYLDFMQRHGGRRSSQMVEWALRGFFEWLESRGVDDISTLKAGDLRDFLDSQKHLKCSTIAGQASVLRVFLRYLSAEGVVRTGLAQSVESPRLYRMSQPPPVVEEQTLERLLAAADRTSPLGKRDFAMMLLAGRCAMRPCDIRGLRLDDIHWREQRILMLQSKTQRPLELPLMADVGEALIDYLRNGRPVCNAREVFVRHVAPITPLAKGNCLWGVMQRLCKAAGVKPGAGPRGLYLLRHSAATRMLSNGVSFDTISDVLGHASVETTRIYAQVDLAGLRSVALSA